MTVLAAPGISYGVPALVSLVLHGVMVALLLVNWSSREDTTVIAKRVPRFIEARLVTAESLQPKKKKATPVKPRHCASWWSRRGRLCTIPRTLF